VCGAKIKVSTPSGDRDACKKRDAKDLNFSDNKADLNVSDTQQSLRNSTLSLKGKFGRRIRKLKSQHRQATATPVNSVTLRI